MKRIPPSRKMRKGLEKLLREVDAKEFLLSEIGSMLLDISDEWLTDSRYMKYG